MCGRSGKMVADAGSHPLSASDTFTVLRSVVAWPPLFLPHSGGVPSNVRTLCAVQFIT